MTVPIFQIFLSFMYQLATKKYGFFPLPEFPTAKSFGGGGASHCGARALSLQCTYFSCFVTWALEHSQAQQLQHRLPEHVGSGATVADLAASQHVGS